MTTGDGSAMERPHGEVDRLSSEVERLRGQAEDRDQRLARVGHELRAPLASIAGYVEVLLDGALGELGEIPAVDHLLALGRDLHAAVAGQLGPDDGVVGEQEAGVILAQGGQQPGRALDVRHPEGDGPGRQRPGGHGHAATLRRRPPSV